jgi:predicted DNA-binding protein with PD1-like motif
VTSGRRILVVLEPGDEVIGALAAACREHAVRQAAVTAFLGAFSRVELIGTSEPVADPDLPLPLSTVLEHVEGTASGTVAPGVDSADGDVVVHLHAAVGVKGAAALGYVGHVLRATTHYTAEVLLEELHGVELLRRPDERAHGIPTLRIT